MSGADQSQNRPRGRKPDLSKREHIVRTGVAIFTEKGFHNTSVDEIVSAAGVPKGSFAYYFGSKDAYAIAVIQCYAEFINKRLDRILSNKEASPADRIDAFMDESATAMSRFDFRRGCLVGNLGQELAGTDEVFRAEVQTALRGWQLRVQECLEELRTAGQLRADADLAAFSRLFWYVWEGAVLGARLDRSRSPMDLVRPLIRSQIEALMAGPPEKGEGRPEAA